MRLSATGEKSVSPSLSFSGLASIYGIPWKTFRQLWLSWGSPKLSHWQPFIWPAALKQHPASRFLIVTQCVSWAGCNLISLKSSTSRLVWELGSIVELIILVPMLAPSTVINCQLSTCVDTVEHFFIYTTFAHRAIADWFHLSKRGVIDRATFPLALNPFVFSFTLHIRRWLPDISPFPFLLFSLWSVSVWSVRRSCQLAVSGSRHQCPVSVGYWHSLSRLQMHSFAASFLWHPGPSIIDSRSQLLSYHSTPLLTFQLFNSHLPTFSPLCARVRLCLLLQFVCLFFQLLSFSSFDLYPHLFSCFSNSSYSSH